MNAITASLLLLLFLSSPWYKASAQGPGGGHGRGLGRGRGRDRGHFFTWSSGGGRGSGRGDWRDDWRGRGRGSYRSRGGRGGGHSSGRGRGYHRTGGGYSVKTATPFSCTVGVDLEPCDYKYRDLVDGGGMRICITSPNTGFRGFQVNASATIERNKCIMDNTTSIDLADGETASCGCCGGVCPGPCAGVACTKSDNSTGFLMNLTKCHRWDNRYMQKCVRAEETVEKQLKGGTCVEA